MSNFLEDIAYLQYENRLPDRDENEEDFVDCCYLCNRDICKGDTYHSDGYYTICGSCFDKFEEEIA